MPFGAALSQHPVPALAAGEVIGSVVEQVGTEPDLAVLFVTAAHTGAIDDIAAAVRELLAPITLVGATASSVLGGRHEIEESPALVLWAARFAASGGGEGGRDRDGDGEANAVVPVRLVALPSAEGIAVTGIPTTAMDGTARTLLLLPDPFTFPADEFVHAVNTADSPLAVVGGLASAARGPGGNRLVLDGEIFSDGAVGVLLPESVRVRPVVSQGCRPIGEPMTVTRAERNILLELAGRPALERLAELLESLPDDERELAANGVHLGRVIDEHQADFARGDFLVRNVLGGDREAGAIAVGDVVDVGSTVQFQVRDAGSADADLRELLGIGGPAAGRAALVFTCNGRGSHLFGEPDHDAALVSDATDGGAVAGMFCAGELGPVGGASFLHGFTASVLLFQD